MDEYACLLHRPFFCLSILTVCLNTVAFISFISRPILPTVLAPTPQLTFGSSSCVSHLWKMTVTLNSLRTTTGRARRECRAPNQLLLHAPQVSPPLDSYRDSEWVASVYSSQVLTTFLFHFIPFPFYFSQLERPKVGPCQQPCCRLMRRLPQSMAAWTLFSTSSL